MWAIKYSRLSDSPAELETVNVAMLFPAAQSGCGCAAVQERRHGFSLHSRSDLNISMRATVILTNTKIADWVQSFQQIFGLESNLAYFFLFVCFVWHHAFIESVVKFCLRSRFGQSW